MKKLQMARDEVEAELKAREERIGRSVTRLRQDLGKPVQLVGGAVRAHPWGVLTGVAVAGLTVAGLLVLRPGISKKSPEEAIAEAYADLVAERTRQGEEEGLSREQAIKTAIRTNPPMMVPPGSHKQVSHLDKMLDRVLASLTAAAFDFISTWISELVDRRNSST